MEAVVSHLFDAMKDLTKAHATGDISRQRETVKNLTEAVLADAAERASRPRQAGTLTHLCVWDAPHARGERRAMCGATVTLRDLAHGGAPTCPTCRQINAQAETDLEALQS